MKYTGIILALSVIGMSMYVFLPAKIDGRFMLINQNASVVRDTDFRGKYRLVFFGFTECPDVCPTTLLTLSKVMSLLKAQKNKLVVLFITVDPDRDSPAKLKTYLNQFDPAFIGLTGTHAQIEQAEKSYGIYASETQSKDANPYTFDHSSFIYLMNPDGKYIRYFPPDAPPQYIAAQLGDYLDDR